MHSHKLPIASRLLSGAALSFALVMGAGGFSDQYS